MLSLFTVPKKAVTTRVIAVRMHADWCDTSRALEQVFQHLKNRFDGKEVLFVTMDYTNNTTKHQSELLAGALGIDEAIGQNVTTGQFLLLNFRSKNIFARLTANISFANMVKVVADKLK